MSFRQMARHPFGDVARRIVLMHLLGVPVAVIAAWIGHRDATLTMRL